MNSWKSSSLFDLKRRIFGLVDNMVVRFPRPTPRRWVGGPMPRKGGNETVLGSARFRCSSMGECDTYLEFCMSKDSIGAAEFGFGQPCTAQGQFESRQGEKMSPWLHPGFTLATTWLTLATTWRQPGDTLATTWRHPGDTLATPWRHPGYLPPINSQGGRWREC